MESLAAYQALVGLMADMDVWHPAVELLLRSRAEALAAQTNVRAFGVRAQQLRELGLTDNQLHVLVRSKCVRPLANTKRARKNGGGCRGTFQGVFAKGTPLAMTDAGIGVVRDVYLRLGELRPAPKIAKQLYTLLVALGEIPRWDASRREFWFRHQRLKKFGVPADHQEGLLTGFHENDWRRHMDDPTPRTKGASGARAQQHLRDAIYGLNIILKAGGLHLRLDGTGEGVSWEIVSAGG